MADSLASRSALSELEDLMRKELFMSSSVSRLESVGASSPNSEFLAELEKLMRQELFLPQYSYEYQKLDSKHSIRLLHLQPGGRDDLIEGYLEEVSTESKANFEALSYTWGDTARNHRIATLKGFLSITSSLRSALIRFRYPDRARALWVDALCINQSDKDEKSDQILLMPKIYSSASRVLVYLGEEANDSHLVMKLIEKIARTNFGKLQNKFDGPNGLFSLDHFGLPSDLDSIWRAFRTFWRRPWFRRVWIIQEFLLGQDVRVICGQWERDWKILFEAIMKIHELGLISRGSRSIFHLSEIMEANSALLTMSYLCQFKARADSAMYIEYRVRLLTELPNSSMLEANDVNFTGCETFIWLVKANPAMARFFSDRSTFGAYPHLFGSQRADPGAISFTGLPLMAAFAITETSQATDGRDRMFANLSLANDLGDQDRIFLRPDYNMSPKMVVCRYASVLIQKGHCMDLLYRGAIRPRSLQMPSWAPDWTATTEPLNQRTLFGLSGANIYQAAGSSESRARIGKDIDILIVAGSFVDVIDWVGVVPITDLESLRDADRMCDGLSSYPTGEPLHEVKWRTLVANKTPTRQIEAPKEYGILYSTWKKLAEKGHFQAQTSLQQLEFTTSSSNAYLEAMGTVRHYKLCRTRGGYVGLVPPSTVIGDSIGVFLGGIVPFILRRSCDSERKEMFRVVGGCYVHGWMKGEALRFPNWREQEIYLH